MEMFLTIKLCTYAETELFSIEQIIYIKMDLALKNLQRLICHKTKQTKPNIYICIYRNESDRKCCKFTLYQTANQRFSKQDSAVKKSGSGYVVDRKCVAVPK